MSYARRTGTPHDGEVLIETIRLRRGTTGGEARERARRAAIEHSDRLRKVTRSEVVRLLLGDRTVGFVVYVYAAADRPILDPEPN